MQVRSSVSLKEFSRIKIGGTAQKAFFPENLNEFIELLKERPAPIVIGGGSNVFFADLVFPEVIVTTKMKTLEPFPDGSFWADCGVKLADLFSFAVGVPATVGGGLVMNFGAYGHDLQEFLLKAEIYDKQKKQIVTLAKNQLKFGYRSSSLKNPQWVILRGLFAKKYLEHQKEWLAQRKKAMPFDKPNLGSIFKNPKENSAGALIEKAGLKNYVVGDAVVSEKHANIIINQGQARAQDLLDLLKYIQQVVQDKFQITLEPEIEYIGF